MLKLKSFKEPSKKLTVTVMCPQCKGGTYLKANQKCTRCKGKGIIEKKSS